MTNQQKLELAWAAGFWDGEGYTQLRDRDPKDNPRNRKAWQMTVSQIERTTLDRFLAAVGVGKVYGPYGPYQVNRQVYWNWTVSSKENCRIAADKMWPYLSEPKRLQIVNTGLYEGE
jgi:hypothetical protein